MSPFPFVMENALIKETEAELQRTSRFRRRVGCQWSMQRTASRWALTTSILGWRRLPPSEYQLHAISGTFPTRDHPTGPLSWPISEESGLQRNCNRAKWQFANKHHARTYSLVRRYLRGSLANGPMLVAQEVVERLCAASLVAKIVTSSNDAR